MKEVKIMNEFLNKKITIVGVIEFLERCFKHSAVKSECRNNIVDCSLANFQFVDINMDMPEINMDFQDITLDFVSVNLDLMAA